MIKFDRVKPWIEISMLVATVFMAFFTMRAVQESRNMRQLEIGPNISLSDVVWEVIDETNTPIKRSSYTKGDDNKDAVYNRTPKRFVIALKFSNTAKSAGYIKQLNSVELISKTKSTAGDVSGNAYLVPANKETNAIFPLDISSADFNVTKIDFKDIRTTEIVYNFEIFDETYTPRKNLAVIIQCTIKTDDKGINTWCSPIKK